MVEKGRGRCRSRRGARASYSIDTDILLYASFEESRHHAAASGFLDDCTGSREPLCLPWPTIMAYLRLATHPKIWSTPLTEPEAIDNVESLLGLPQTRTLGEGALFWESYRRITAEMTVRGNLVSDAHIAAILLGHDVKVLYTNDRDFRKFDSLEARNPLRNPAPGPTDET